MILILSEKYLDGLNSVESEIITTGKLLMHAEEEEQINEVLKKIQSILGE